MEQNEPIGIPSGWEELAAWAVCMAPGVRDIIINELSKGYITGILCSHDWRVEE